MKQFIVFLPVIISLIIVTGCVESTIDTPLPDFSVETFTLTEDFFTVVMELESEEKRVMTYPVGTEVVVWYMESGPREGWTRIGFFKEDLEEFDYLVVVEDFSIKGYSVYVNNVGQVEELSYIEEELPETFQVGDKYHLYSSLWNSYYETN